jgi:hypothetical protein
MTRRHVVLSALFVCAATLASWGQTPAKSGRLDIVAVIGCVAENGDAWTLTNATGSLPEFLAVTTDAKVAAATTQKAKKQSLGQDRYRMIGLLDFFEVAKHKGEKVLVKAIAIGEPRERRLNLLSISPLTPTC